MIVSNRRSIEDEGGMETETQIEWEQLGEMQRSVDHFYMGHNHVLQ